MLSKSSLQITFERNVFLNNALIRMNVHTRFRGNVMTGADGAEGSTVWRTSLHTMRTMGRQLRRRSPTMCGSRPHEHPLSCAGTIPPVQEFCAFWCVWDIHPSNPSIHPSIHPYIHPSTHTSIHLCLGESWASIHPPIHQRIHPSIHPSIHAYIHTSMHA